MSRSSLFHVRRPGRALSCLSPLFRALLSAALVLGGLLLPCAPASVPAATGGMAAAAARETPGGKTAAESAAAPGAAHTAGEAGGAAEDTAPSGPAEPAGNAAWEAVWTGQRAMLDEVRQTALKLSDSFGAQTENLSRQLQPFEEEGRRLLVFANTFKGHPNAMEAVSRRIAATIGDLAKAVQRLFGDTGTNIIGTRHGEKLYETLMTREERLRSEDMGQYFRVAADNRDLNYDKYFVKGQVQTMAEEAYTSHNTQRLDVEGTVRKILTTDYVKEALEVWEAEKR